MAYSGSGKRVFEILQTLKEYKTHDLKEEDLNELVMVPKKKTLFSVLFYIMDLLHENWRHECSPILLSKKDESQFLTLACKHIRQLGKETSGVAIPPITPSSLSGLYGEKFVQFFYKLTSAIMLKIMEKEGFTGEEECLKEELSDLEDKIEELEKVTEEKRTIKQSVVKKEKEILEHIILAGDWREIVKNQLLDLNNEKIVEECMKELEKCKEERSEIEKELSPYLHHISNCVQSESCSCDSKYLLSENKSNAIRSLMVQKIHVRVKFEIQDLKSRAAVRHILQGDGGEENGSSDLQKLIGKLESLMDCSQFSPLRNVQIPSQESPALEYAVTPCIDSLFDNFSPSVELSKQMRAQREERVKVDVGCLSLRWLQRGVTVTASPGTLPARKGLTCGRTAKPTVEEPAQPKDLFSIVRRLQAASGCKPRRSNSFHFENGPGNRMPGFTPLRRCGSEMGTPTQPRGPSEEPLSTQLRCMLSRRRLTEESPFVEPTAALFQSTPFQRPGLTPFQRAGMTPFQKSRIPSSKGAEATPVQAREIAPFKGARDTPRPAKTRDIAVEEALDKIVRKIAEESDPNDTFSDGEWSSDRIACSTLVEHDSHARSSPLARLLKIGDDSSLSSFSRLGSSNCESPLEGKEKRDAEGEQECEEVLAHSIDLADVQEAEPQTPVHSSSLQELIKRFNVIKYGKKTSSEVL